MDDIIFMKILDTKVPWSQRFFLIFLRMRWENHSCEAANVNHREKSRKTARTRVTSRTTSSPIFVCQHENPTTYCSLVETNQVPGNPAKNLDEVHLYHCKKSKIYSGIMANRFAQNPLIRTMWCLDTSLSPLRILSSLRNKCFSYMSCRSSFW